MRPFMWWIPSPSPSGRRCWCAAALEMRDRGLRAEDIFKAVTALVPRVRLYAVIDDLKYLRLGGRLSSAGAVMGTLLGIKPLVHIEEGKVVSLAKARGQKAGYQMILERVREEGVDQDYPVYFGHSNAPAMMEELEELIRSACALPQTYESAIGPVVGTMPAPAVRESLLSRRRDRRPSLSPSFPGRFLRVHNREGRRGGGRFVPGTRTA